MSSISDVAREANVAASTVSRVINGSARISAKTQQRVHEAVRRLGYMPHGGDNRRKQQRAWHLGVVYSPWMVVNGAVVGVCRDWIIGIKQTVIEAGGHLEIIAGSPRVELDTMYRHSLDNQELHGVILIGAQRSSGYIEDTTSRNIPVVVISDRSARGNVSSVYADMYNAGRLAIDHLVSLGHRRIALGNLPTGLLWSTDQRRLGALEALQDHGLSPALDKQADAKFDDLAYFEESAREVIASKATALFCSDFAAIRYIETLDRLGVSVPRDFSVVGCDNNALIPTTGQSLTTIDYDKIAMGRLAASNLMRLIRKQGEIQHIETSVPTKLLVQQSTGPAPQSNVSGV